MNKTGGNIAIIIGIIFIVVGFYFLFNANFNLKSNEWTIDELRNLENVVEKQNTSAFNFMMFLVGGAILCVYGFYLNNKNKK